MVAFGGEEQSQPFVGCGSSRVKTTSHRHDKRCERGMFYFSDSVLIDIPSRCGSRLTVAKGYIEHSVGSED